MIKFHSNSIRRMFQVTPNKLVLIIGRSLCLLSCEVNALDNQESKPTEGEDIKRHGNKFTKLISKILLRWTPFLFTFLVILHCVAILVSRKRVAEADYLSPLSIRLVNVFYPFYTFNCALLYIFFLRKSNQFARLLEKLVRYKDNPCRLCRDHGCCLSPSGNEAKLRGFMYLGFALVTVIETFTYDIRTAYSLTAEEGRNRTNDSFLRKYSAGDLFYLTDFVEFNPYIAALFYIVVKMATYSNAYVNIVPVVMFTYLTDIFKTYISCLQNALQKSFKQKSIVQWELLHDEYLKLKRLTREVSSFSSVLVVSSYGISLTMSILAVFEFLEISQRAEIGPKSTFQTLAYAYISLVYFSLRLFLLTYFAAEVNNNSADKILQVIDSYPGIPCSWSMQRFEKMLERDKHPPGIYILDTFLITRNFFISMTSLICTTEIVLLQTAPGYN